MVINDYMLEDAHSMRFHGRVHHGERFNHVNVMDPWWLVVRMLRTSYSVIALGCWQVSSGRLSIRCSAPSKLWGLSAKKEHHIFGRFVSFCGMQHWQGLFDVRQAVLGKWSATGASSIAMLQKLPRKPIRKLDSFQNNLGFEAPEKEQRCLIDKSNDSWVFF